MAIALLLKITLKPPMTPKKNAAPPAKELPAKPAVAAAKREARKTKAAGDKAQSQLSAPSSGAPSAFPPREAFLNREMGAIGFNRTVLSLAQKSSTPLLERLRYLSIVSANLDEFFEIRIAELRERIGADDRSLSIDGRSPTETYAMATAAAGELQAEQYRLFNEEIGPALRSEGIGFLRHAEWSPELTAWLRSHFDASIAPLLTPIGLDPAHPFPRLANKSLNFLIELSGKDAYGRAGGIAILPTPHALAPLISLPASLSGMAHGFATLSCVLAAFAGSMFPKMDLLGVHPFRITRNSDLFVDEEEVKNLLATIQGEIVQRNFGAAVRLEVDGACPPSARDFLLRHFELSERELAVCHGPVNLARFMGAPDLAARPDLKFPVFRPGYPNALRKRGANMFEAIARRDILLHHPYESYAPVTTLLAQASVDPLVAAIKMTVYRTGEDSALMESLARAAHNGKEVTVVLELMARFDEAANIRWAAKLEEAGAHVVFGAVGFKTHAKMLLIVRRETDPETGAPLLRRYAHFGTGNYNSKTARLYTDFSLFTCEPSFGADANEIFQQLTGLGQPEKLESLCQAPFGLHRMAIESIAEQTELARQGKPALIRAKMNALLEPEVIRALCEASQAGVQVRLLVRGMCALRPGVKGLSENIQVRSVVGRFLEHHRLFAFGIGDAAKAWLSSADWMDRNFFRRIEIAFPLLDKKMRRRALDEGFDSYWNSSANVFELLPDGSRVLVDPLAGPEQEAQAKLAALLGRYPEA